VSAGKTVLGNPKTEVSCQIYCFSSVDLTGAMLLVKELRDEVVTDEWGKICIASCCVFCLWDVNVFFFFIFLHLLILVILNFVFIIFHIAVFVLLILFL